MRRLGVVVLGVGLLGVGACSHLVQETSQPVQVISSPDGAQVRINDTVQLGETPLTVYLDPRRTYAVTVEKPCYTAGTVQLQPSMGLRSYGTVQIPVNQLAPTVHVALRPTCDQNVKREGR